MGTRRRWLKRQINCGERDGESTLLTEWRYSGEGATLNGINCDNPRLRDIDNWDCRWSCWEKVSKWEADKK